MVFYDMSLLGYDEHSLGKKQYISWQNHHILFPADNLHPRTATGIKSPCGEKQRKKGLQG